MLASLGISTMTEPIDIPSDINVKTSTVFPDPKSRQDALTIIKEFHDRKRGLNVGPQQFCRAILILSGGDISEFKRLAAIPDDPRDILMAGEAKLGNPNHYFKPPFDDPAYNFEND